MRSIVGPHAYLGALLIIAQVSVASAAPIISNSDIETFIIPERTPGGKPPASLGELVKALEAFRKDDYEQSLANLIAARKKDPDLPPAHLMLARAFLFANQFQPARAALEEGAALDPAYPGVYVALGDLALIEGRRADALVHFEKVAALARSGKWPDKVKNFFLARSQAGLGSVAEVRQDWTGAKAAFTALLELEPKNGNARQRLAAALVYLDQFEEAHALMLQAIANDKTLPPAAIFIGWICTRKGDVKKAAEWMEAAVKKDGNDSRVLAGYAAWLLEQGQAQKAKSFAEAALKLEPDFREARVVSGLIAWQMKDYAESERFFQRLNQESPGDFLSANQLVLALIEQSSDTKRQRALQLAEINARVFPDSADALATLGWVYFQLGKLGDAERAARAAQARRSGSSDTAYRMARILSESAKPEDIKQLLKTALGASGRFTFRKEAQEWLDRLAKKP